MPAGPAGSVAIIRPLNPVTVDHVLVIHREHDQHAAASFEASRRACLSADGGCRRLREREQPAGQHHHVDRFGRDADGAAHPRSRRAPCRGRWTPRRGPQIRGLLLERPVSAPEWRSQALCRPGSGINPDDLFPDPMDAIGRRAAALICAECPVTQECLAAADSMQEHHGVWGGMARNQFTGTAARITGGRPPKNKPTPDERCGEAAGYAAHRRRNECPCPACLEAENYASRYRRHGADTR